MQGAHVHGRAGLGVQINGAAGVRGHGIEMPGAEFDIFALARGGDIVDVVFRQTGLGQ